MAQLKLMKKEWFNWFDKTFLDNITAWTEYYYINPDSQHWISNNIYSIQDVSGVENGVTYSSSNGIIRMRGTWTGAGSGFISALEKVIYLKAGTYTLSAFNPEAIDPAYVVRLRATELNYSIIAEKQLDSPNESLTFTLSNDREVRIFLRMGTFSSEDDFVLKPMLVPGNTAPEAFSPHLIKIEDILGVVNLGDLSWEYDAEGHIQFRSNGIASLVKKPSVNSIPRVFTTAPYEIVSPLTFNGSRDKINLTINETTGVIHIHNPNITNVQIFKNSLKDVYMIYLKVDSPY